MSSLSQEHRAAAWQARGAWVVLCCAPLLVLTVRGWASAVLFVGAFASALLLAGGTLPRPALSPQDRRWMRLLVLTFSAPLLSTALAAALRQDLAPEQFDAPLRFVLAIPVFLFMLRAGRPVARVMVEWVLPLGLLGALVYLVVLGQDPRWPAARVTTRVVDPLVFGYLSLAFGMMCLVSIDPREWRQGPRWSALLRLLACALGLALSILSSSRSGWAALPIVLGLWGYYHWGRGHPVAAAGALVTPVLLCVIGYLAIPTVTARIDEMVQEVAEYRWNGVLDPATSVGYRITYLRLAADIFAMHPWAGVGDTSRKPPPLPSNAFPYASPRTVAAAFSSGFHNQIASNAVRNGLGGLLATAALLLVPLVICWRALRRSALVDRKDAFTGAAYCVCMLVTSLSTEIVDLKFAASLYAVMSAALCGAVLGTAAARDHLTEAPE